jgi:hypothetical protein
VLIFSHGRGGYRQHNTMQVEELVSHGYIVAAIDHPYAATGVVFPDGRIAAFDPRMFDPSAPESSRIPGSNHSLSSQKTRCSRSIASRA